MKNDKIIIDAKLVAAIMDQQKEIESLRSFIETLYELFTERDCCGFFSDIAWSDRECEVGEQCKKMIDSWRDK